MKCKKCGNELKNTDKICLNCGTLVDSLVNDLYNDINIDDEDNDKFNDTRSKYNNEVEDLLNSYDDEINDENSHYSSVDRYDEDNNKDDNNYDSSYDEDEYDSNNLVEFTDNDDYEYNNDNDNYTDFGLEEENSKFNMGNIPFKIVFIVAAIVLVIIVFILIFKVILSNNNKTAEYKTDNTEKPIESKYSLTTNPNYIKGKSWICGDSDEFGNLTSNRLSYFQYDFDNDGTYEMKFLSKDDSYENGTYTLSLEDISNDQYTYKLTITANLDGGYKTRYNFTLITDKEGNKGTYRLNTSESKCEEMDYFNSK